MSDDAPPSKRVGTPVVSVRTPLPRQAALTWLALRLGYRDRSELLRVVFDELTRRGSPLAQLIPAKAPVAPDSGTRKRRRK